MARTNTLDLTDGQDGADIVTEVERTFGISISDNEAAETLTVGQLQDLIEAKCGSGAIEVCLSQVAFYRLRRALRELGVAMVMTPTTPVTMIASIQDQSIRRTWKAVAQSSGLRLPGLETPFTARFPKWMAWLGSVGVGMSFFATLLATEKSGLQGAAVFGWLVGLPVVFGLISFAWHHAFGTIPIRIATIGDLAREAAGHSFAELSRKRASRADRWSALTAILRDLSGYKLPITRNMSFYAP